MAQVGAKKLDIEINNSADLLADKVVVVASVLLAVACSTFLIIHLIMNVQELSRFILNGIGAVLGVLVLWLFKSGKRRLANWMLVWIGFALAVSIVSQTNGLRSPLLLYYPFLIVLSGWLLGFAPTIALFVAMQISVVVFYSYDAHFHIPASNTDKLVFVLPLFYFFSLLLITVVSLFARKSLMSRIEAALKLANDLSLNQAELNKKSQLVEQSPASILICDQDGKVEYVNAAFTAHHGYVGEEIIGQNVGMLIADNTPRAMLGSLRQALSEGAAWRGEFRNRRKNGEELIEYAIVSPVKQVDGQVSHITTILQDITQYQKAQEQIKHLAYFDWLTDLPNRAMLLHHLNEAIEAYVSNAQCAALILLNIDRFKHINDARGHALGDALLQAMGARLASLLESHDTLARLDADQFAILVTGLVGDRDHTLQHVQSVVEKIQMGLQTPFHCGNVEDVKVTARLGVALLSDVQAATHDAVLRCANTALHQAKEGHQNVVYYDRAMSDAVEQHFRIERELRAAIATGQLRIYLQPQVDGVGVRVGAEALVRWQHPERGLISPNQFIPIAEETELIIDLGIWVMTHSCQLIAQEAKAGRVLRLSVNISPRHFRQPGFVSWLKQLLVNTEANPNYLMLEVTEGLLIDDVNDVIAKMNELAALGIHFSIDDFGTGYSSLAYLKRLPIDELKIDKSFVQDVSTDSDDAAIVDSILAIAAHMKLQIVAEGVETIEQADFLNRRGKITHQGYLYGRPEEASVCLARWQQTANMP